MVARVPTFTIAGVDRHTGNITFSILAPTAPGAPRTRTRTQMEVRAPVEKWGNLPILTVLRNASELRTELSELLAMPVSEQEAPSVLVELIRRFEDATNPRRVHSEPLEE